MNRDTVLYPPIEPYKKGMLEAGEGHLIYWETCGNPQGKPALVLHGGPGSGCSESMRRFFNPEKYKVILFDQRNCGRSKPHASNVNVELSTNTTPDLLRDIELLRETLGIERWLLYGGSWGSTLALAYAEKNPQRVSEIVLTGVTTTRKTEIDWLYRDVAPLFPEQWQHFQDGVAEDKRDGDLVEAYYPLLLDPNPAVHREAARRWCDWEIALFSVDPDAKPDARRLEPAFQLAFARIVTHYFRHRAWLEEGQLLREAGTLAGIPGVMVHGRLDLGAPLMTAWELNKAWPKSELVLISRAGHSSGDPGMTEAIVAALDRFA